MGKRRLHIHEGRKIIGLTKKQSRKKKALVVTTRNVHYKIVRPVVKGLQKRHWKVTVLRFERMWERVESLLRRTTKGGVRSLEKFMSAPPVRQKRINWYAYNFIAKFVFVLMRVFKVEKPNIILVLTDSTPPSKIAVLVGRTANIPSLLLLHVGMIGRNYACPRFLVDKIAVTGKFAKDMLIKCGVDETRLAVTGRPTYDSLVRRKKYFEKDKICNKLGLDPKKKIVVFTTQPFLRKNETQVYAICKAMKEFSGLQFVIKVHPAELSLSNYERITKDVGVHALITRDADIYEVLYVCDAMITGFSATALDTMILDKPVITFNFTGLEDPVPYAESGAAIGVYEEKDLIRAIDTVLFDKDAREKLMEAREKFVYEHSYKTDGKSTERAIKLIEQMVDEQQ